jgi:SAM-dependent methyltransferase
MGFFKVAERVVRAALPPPVFAIVHRTERGVRSSAWRIAHPGREHSCPFCGKQFGKFIPYVNRYEISVTADIVSGQSIRANKCPCCHSYDRERGLYFYLKERVALAGKRVLHIAPEDSLHALIASSGCAEYVCGDLDPRSYYPVSSAVRRIDLLDIGYPDRYFDLAICNHILEHIPDDLTAMREIFRVLKSSGMAILLVPIGAKLRTTYEDPSKRTPEERARAFGQYNHVRIYSESDYLQRLRSVGFHTIAETPRLSEQDVARFGINAREKIYLAIRPV